ncbi:hypothetical protein ACTXT7_002373 [Hymenolepis weldensis]
MSDSSSRSVPEYMRSGKNRHRLHLRLNSNPAPLTNLLKVNPKQFIMTPEVVKQQLSNANSKAVLILQALAADQEFAEIYFNPSLRFECLFQITVDTKIHCGVSTDWAFRPAITPLEDL